MEKSDKIDLLTKALIAAEKEFQPVVKNKQNPHFKSDYADLNATIEATKPSLLKFGLQLLQGQIFENGEDLMETLLTHESGQWISFKARMRPTKQDPQGMGSAVSYYRRYGQNSVLNVSQEDDDGNHASAGESASHKAVEQMLKPASPSSQKPLSPSKSGAKVISEGQVKRLWAIGFGKGLAKGDIMSVVKEFGYLVPDEIVWTDYEKVIDRIQNGPKPKTNPKDVPDLEPPPIEDEDLPF
jgi:hypothetical protein